MTRYKVIPLPFYHIADDLDEFLMHGKGLLEKYTKIDPIFNRYGMYLDRQENFAWIETKFGCWRLDSTKGFHEHLYYISNDERLLHKDIVRAMRVIYNHGLRVKELRRLSYDHECAAMVKATYRSARKWRLSIIGK